MYFHNEGKSVGDERLIRSLRNKIYQYITSVLKNVSIDTLDYIINKYNNTYFSTINIKHVDIKENTYVDCSKEINDKHRNFKIVYNVRGSKNKNVFANVYSPNWYE